MSDLPLPQQLRRADEERRRKYRDNLDFYNGEQWQGRPRLRERRLTVNYARVLIDKTTSYLMSGLDWVVDATGDSQTAKDRARRAEDLLYTVAEQNNLAALDFDTEIDTAVLGDGCYKVTWDPAEGRARISAPDVQGLFAWWVGDDLSRVWRVASQYELDAESLRLLYGVTSPPDPLSRTWRGGGAKALVTEDWTAAEFSLWVDASLLWRRANPYGFLPFVLFPNVRKPKAFWGESDITIIKESARELNRALTALSQIIELSGNPIAVLENVERAEDIAVAPGAIWELPEKAKAYLLDLLSGGGVKLHIDYITTLYKTLHDLAETPRTAFGDNQKALSGVALEMELHPLLQRIRRKRLLRSEVYRRRNELVLRLYEQFGGVPALRPYRSRVIWGPVLPQDRARQVTEEQKLVSSGIHSRRRSMNELGVEDPDRELARWLEEERQIRDLTPRPSPGRGEGMEG